MMEEINPHWCMFPVHLAQAIDSKCLSMHTRQDVCDSCPYDKETNPVAAKILAQILNHKEPFEGDVADLVRTITAKVEELEIKDADLIEVKQIKKIRTINEEWENFRKIVVNKDAGPQQLTALKDAFFAGAYVIFELATKNIGALDPEDSLEALNQINGELTIHFEKPKTVN